MKRILVLIAMIALSAFAFSGCGSGASAKVPCEGGCGMEMAKSDATEVDGQFYCAGCAAHAGHEQEAMDSGDMSQDADAAQVACAGGCGMDMAKSDAKEIDGKFYCAGCAAHAGHGH